MPIYSYQAIDSKGGKKTGLIDATQESEAKLKLREQGLMVSKLELRKGASSKENLKGEQLQGFTMQLGQLVGAGVPVYESMLALEDQYRGEAFGRVILSLCEKIKAGSSLSEAMHEFPGSFNRLYCAMVSAGESAGALDIVFERLADLLAKQQKLRRDLMTALIYPGILAGFCCVLIVILLGFVVPMIEGIFEGRELNAYTAFVISLSHAFRTWWWIYLPLMALSIGYLIYRLRTPEGKLWIERFLLKVPVVRWLIIQAAVARFTRTMSTLLKGGLTMIDALHISREVMQNYTMEEEIKQAEARIVEGSSLSAELSKSKYIPRMVSRMLAVGEESGASAEMLGKVADMYENNVEKTLERVMALAQPVILIVMGFIIGSVMLSILLPLADMSSLQL